MKKFCRLLFLCALTFSLASESLVAAVGVTPSPSAANSTPPLVITSLVGNNVFPNSGAIELFNQADTPIELDGWRADFSFLDSCGSFAVSQPLKHGWLLAGEYQTVIFGNVRSGCTAPRLNAVTVLNGDTINQVVTVPTTSPLPDGKIVQHKQRGNSSSTRIITGIYTTDYNAAKPVDAASATLYDDPLYEPPADASGLQILEILPHARDCAPDDNTSPDCVDYVKLYNPTTLPIDLSQYRLRIGYKGQSIGVTNTFHFGQSLAPSKYFTLAARDDGEALSITDSGNYVWLEDTHGVKTYSPIVQYPSATSSSKIGWSWAWDGTMWRWTSAPHPFDANYFPPEVPAATSPSNSSTLKPCAANQYRSAETNRCRLIISASTLVPCRSDQTRNPETNRCRSILASSSSLQPCKAGQVRNPETNRCKSAVTTASSLKPCQPGWERNPDTNRCRKGTVLGDATAKVQDVRAPTAADHTRWLLAGIAVIGALAYAAYEWRQELALKFAGITAMASKLTRSKK